MFVLIVLSFTLTGCAEDKDTPLPPTGDDSTKPGDTIQTTQIEEDIDKTNDMLSELDVDELDSLESDLEKLT